MELKPWSNSETEQKAINLLYASEKESFSSPTCMRLVIYLLLVIIERLDWNFAKGAKP
jgi:hypothetical protein